MFCRGFHEGRGVLSTGGFVHRGIVLESLQVIKYKCINGLSILFPIPNCYELSLIPNISITQANSNYWTPYISICM